MPKGYLQWVELLLASRHVFRYSPCLSFQSSSLCPVPVGSKELTLAWTSSSTRRTRKFPDTPRELKKSGSTLLLWRNCWLNTWTGKTNESFWKPLFFNLCINVRLFYELNEAFTNDGAVVFLCRFSEVFNTVARNSHDDVFYEDDIWPGEDQNG